MFLYHFSAQGNTFQIVFQSALTSVTAFTRVRYSVITAGVVYTQSDQTVRLYIDGVLGTSPQSFAGNTFGLNVTHDISVGGAPFVGVNVSDYRYFEGQLFDFLFYGRALSDVFVLCPREAIDQLCE